MLDTIRSCGCEDTANLAGLMSIEDARDRALSLVSPLTGRETLALAQALGRIASCAVSAPAAMPFFTNSAMDGFAVSAADYQSGSCLPISATIAAGDAPSELCPGTAARIYTGAPVPLGADAVVMSEKSEVLEDSVRFAGAPTTGDNIRCAGSDQPLGAVLLKPGQSIAPRHIGLLAANGINRCTVHRRVRVGVFSTGDELTSGTLRPGQIRDANRPMLLALCAQMGAEATDLGVLPDDLAKTIDAFNQIEGRFDLVLTSGAVSVGGRDHIRAALIAAGGTLDGWRVAIKPGKPVAFGRLGHTIVTGLPGNPFASFVGFHLFAAPQVERLSGGEPRVFASQKATAGFQWQRKHGRAEVFPVKCKAQSPNGLPTLERLGASVSATLFPLACADGLAIVPAETDSVVSGDRLHWQPFCSTGGVQ